MKQPESLVPEQHTGISKEVHEHLDCTSAQEARSLFNKARSRLLDVNHWANTAEGSSAKFLLCDAAGNAVNRTAQQGDLMRIDLPAPHRKSDSGFDWVQLNPLAEGVDEHGAPWFVMGTHPVPDPTGKESEAPAHFFSRESSGTFVLRVRGLRVEVTHYGRNEKPNTEGPLLDAARAVLVTTGAYLGLSDVQWGNLVKGLLAQD